MKQISSIQNPLVKSLVQLQEKAKIRRQTGTFLMEGKRELELAIQGGYELETVLYCPDFLALNDVPKINPETEVIEISKEVYQKLAYRDTTEGLLGVAVSRSLSLSDLNLPKNPLILVAQSPEKPGNIGAMLRTADAAGIDAVIVVDPKTDLYNPNVVRSSVGGLFTNQIATGTSAEVIDFLKQNNIAIYCATLQDSTPYFSPDYQQPTALVVGTEATGLSQIWREVSDQNIIIPMQGALDSMNVSVAAAILLFEAKRQRNFK